MIMDFWLSLRDLSENSSHLFISFSQPQTYLVHPTSFPTFWKTDKIKMEYWNFMTFALKFHRITFQSGSINIANISSIFIWNWYKLIRNWPEHRNTADRTFDLGLKTGLTVSFKTCICSVLDYNNSILILVGHIELSKMPWWGTKNHKR